MESRCVLCGQWPDDKRRSLRSCWLLMRIPGNSAIDARDSPPLLWKWRGGVSKWSTFPFRNGKFVWYWPGREWSLLAYRTAYLTWNKPVQWFGLSIIKASGRLPLKHFAYAQTITMPLTTYLCVSAVVITFLLVDNDRGLFFWPMSSFRWMAKRKERNCEMPVHILMWTDGNKI